MWREVIQRMDNGLCEGMVCVKWCNIVWLVCKDMINGFTNQIITQAIYSHKPDNHTNQIIWNTSQIITQIIIILCITSLHTNHPFTQTIYSHKPDNHTKPSLHTNLPVTQTMYHSLYYIPSHKPPLHTNHLSFSVLHPFTQTLPSHKPSLHTNPLSFSGLCEGM